MYLSKPYRTIPETHIGNALSLSPTSLTKSAPQLWQLTNGRPSSESFNFRYLPNNFKIQVHGSMPNGTNLTIIQAGLQIM
jgi:hypothetical protein